MLGDTFMQQFSGILLAGALGAGAGAGGASARAARSDESHASMAASSAEPVVPATIISAILLHRPPRSRSCAPSPSSRGRSRAFTRPLRARAGPSFTFASAGRKRQSG